MLYLPRKKEKSWYFIDFYFIIFFEPYFDGIKKQPRHFFYKIYLYLLHQLHPNQVWCSAHSFLPWTSYFINNIRWRTLHLCFIKLPYLSPLVLKTKQTQCAKPIHQHRQRPVDNRTGRVNVCRSKLLLNTVIEQHIVFHIEN